MNITRSLRQWLDRRRVRLDLLATPGVDLLVVRVMDANYGKHNWRVNNGVLEGSVQTGGQGEPWWGPIGPLRDPNVRAWLRSGGRQVQVSHAKLEPMEFDYAGPYDAAYADTEPADDETRP